MPATTINLDHLKARQIELAWSQHQGRRTSRHGRSMTAANRDRLCGEQNWRCCYCGNRMDALGADDNAPSFEHVVPRSVGGPDTLDNLVIACRGCNTGRGSVIGEVHIAAVHAWEGWE